MNNKMNNSNINVLTYFNTIIIIIFISIAFITNPSEKQHKEAVTDRFNFWFLQTRIAGLSGSEIKLEENINPDSLKITNFGLFSISKFVEVKDSYEKSKEIGFGIFGRIFISNEIDDKFESVIVSSDKY